MRQGQQHRRGRSRGGHNNHSGSGSGGNTNNNNRKGQNPISRTYQSNGPDGKVSGTADGIAAKYLSLARDATTSGDPVLAENYLQHAEHYNRIILAYRETQAQAGSEDANGGPQRSRSVDASDADDLGEDEGESYGRNMEPLPPMEGTPRPTEQRQPDRPSEQPPRSFEGGRDGGNRDQGRQDGQRYDDRQPRFNDQQRRNNQPRDRFEPRDRYQGERFNNGDRGNGDRGTERQNGGDRGPRPERVQNDRYQGDRQPFVDRQPRDGGFADRPERVMREGARDGAQPRLDPRPDNRMDRPDVRPEVRPEPRPELPVRDLPRPEIPLGAEQPAIISTEPVVRAPRAPRRERAPAAVVAEHEQPEFLRRPVRRPRRDAAAADDVASVPAPTDSEPGSD